MKVVQYTPDSKGQENEDARVLSGVLKKWVPLPGRHHHSWKLLESVVRPHFELSQ